MNVHDDIWVLEQDYQDALLRSSNPSTSSDSLWHIYHTVYDMLDTALVKAHPSYVPKLNKLVTTIAGNPNMTMHVLCEIAQAYPDETLMVRGAILDNPAFALLVLDDPTFTKWSFQGLARLSCVSMLDKRYDSYNALIERALAQYINEIGHSHHPTSLSIISNQTHPGTFFRTDIVILEIVSSSWKKLIIPVRFTLRSCFWESLSETLGDR